MIRLYEIYLKVNWIICLIVLFFVGKFLQDNHIDCGFGNFGNGGVYVVQNVEGQISLP